MDPILAYMRHMLKKASEKGVPVTRDTLVALGKDIEYYPGVEDWFERINTYGKHNFFLELTKEFLMFGTMKN